MALLVDLRRVWDGVANLERGLELRLKRGVPSARTPATNSVMLGRSGSMKDWPVALTAESVVMPRWVVCSSTDLPKFVSNVPTAG